MGELTKAQRICLTEAERGCVHTFARGTYRSRGAKDPGAFNSRTLLALEAARLLERRLPGEVFHITPAGRAALAPPSTEGVE